MDTKRALKHGVLIIFVALASTVSYATAKTVIASGNGRVIFSGKRQQATVVIAPAMYTETCSNRGGKRICIEHQAPPEYFAFPVHISGREPTQITTQYVPSSRSLFFNPNGLPAPRYHGKPVPAYDCVYRGHVLQPGGEWQKYDQKTGMHWHRVCRYKHGRGVMSPAVSN